MMKFLMAAAIGISLATSSQASDEPVKIGLLFGFTGPIESMAPTIASSAELALRQADESGLFLGGRPIEAVRADSTCIDAAAAKVAAERLLSADGVAAFVGADCSGVATAVVNSVAVPRGVVSVSPSATSPALTDIKDNGLFFRTAPSDARQGEVLAEVLLRHGIRSVAVTYTKNDYGKGLADSLADAYEKRGGKVAIELAHVDGKADYTAEVGSLAASGADVLVVAGYADQGGRQIVRAALDSGAFERFVFPDGMMADSLLEEFGDDLTGTIGTMPGARNERTETFEAMLREAGISGQAPYRAEAYDAAALLVLAIHAAGSTAGKDIAAQMLRVANAPGEPIAAGQIAEGLRILSEGGEIDYVGASAVEFSDIGEAAGTYREVVISGGIFETVKIW